MDFKTGSKEEIDALERVENKRIESAERKWKIELRDKRVSDRRTDILGYLNKNGEATFGLWCIVAVAVVIGLVCMIKITWHFFS